ncbi:hypothetical protein CEW87_05545 [Parazoarcus communis]|uniref:Transposase n=1 Tax=Parazoarcus communis TaxID=41977 RepID=A0A2U8GUU2_9RHOO|nr:TniB family NTP-binding protein [Parazoarcus communis]AWI76215.1 hypothetical protein CEW83_14150 [Parazoarcus communis]AWI78867.1 hypothetical protein CEW87_05545 [Parazoarcus communis]
MNFQNTLRAAVEKTVIHHPRFQDAYERIGDLLRSRKDGLDPQIDFIVGPSRCGKTEVLREFARERDYCARREAGRLIVPVLYVPIPTGIAPKDLPLSVMQALNVPLPTGRTRATELVKMMNVQLKLVGTHTILFDEASHLVDVGSKIPPRQASDWIKDISQQTNVSILLSGLYRLIKLLETNEQLRNRTPAPFDFSPYRWDIPSDRKNFAGCVRAFLSVFSDHQCTLDVKLTTDSLVRHLYAASAGHVGLLANFFKALTRQLDEHGKITIDALKATTNRLHLPGNGSIKPFQQDVLYDEHLLQVLCAELNRYDFCLPSYSPEVQLAQIRHHAGAVHR